MREKTVTTLKPTLTTFKVISEIFGRKLIIQRVIGWNVAWCRHLSLIKGKIKQFILCMHAYQRRCNHSRAFFIHSLLAFFPLFCFFSFIFFIVAVMLFFRFFLSVSINRRLVLSMGHANISDH